MTDHLIPRPSSSLPCGVCKAIFTSTNLLGGRYAPKPTRITRPLAEWKASAALGCPLCWWLLYSPSCHNPFEWSIEHNFHLAPKVDTLTFEMGRSDDSYGSPGRVTALGPLEAPEGKMKAIFLYPMAEEGDPAAEIWKARPPAPVDSEETFTSARTWIAECVARKHSKCAKKNSGFAPTRLLDVSHVTLTPSESARQDDLVYLAEPASGNRVETYATLSYCWGRPGDQLLTTKYKLAAFKSHGIKFSALPLTIQDAVRVTRRLGLEFIWVDALCIVQDDDDDKSHEIARMADIYRNSFVTISAATAQNVSDGFLDKREIWSGHNLGPIWLPWEAEADKLGYKTGCVGLYHNLMPSLRVNDYIHERAWTFQETLLSSRLLAFGGHQMYYSCLCDASFGPVRTRGGNYTAIDTLHRPLRILPTDEYLPRGATWAKAVAEYSSRKMSVETDKLPALAGVAQMYGTAEDWLAGIWRKDLPRALLWRPALGHESASRQSEWRAPTWSWCSLDGVIDIWDRNMVYKDFVNEATVIQANVIPTHEFDKFGSIKSAELVLRGFARKTIYEASTRRLLLSDSEDAGQLHISNRSNQPAIPLTCFYLHAAEQSNKVTGSSMGMVGVGLLLQAAENGTYRRIGIFRSLPSTHRYFSPNTFTLLEFELSPKFDLSPYTWPIYYVNDGKGPRHFGVSCGGSIIKDTFPPQAILAFGALLQCLISFCFPAKYALVPALVSVLYMVTDKGARYLFPANVHYDHRVIPGRVSAQIPDPTTGAFDSKAASTGLVVLHVGARCNHPLGVLAPGFQEFIGYFKDMNVDLKARASEFGLYSVTTWTGNETPTNNAMMNIYYFRDMDCVSRFAHDVLHRKGWSWYKKGKYPYLGVFHEVYDVPAQNWENIYANMQPTLLGDGAIACNPKETDETVWINPLVDANIPALRGMLGRMGRKTPVVSANNAKEGNGLSAMDGP
ncbi:Monooxygenase [Paramyrothecium foliicola]|nr:Monooxygenase [Paramyrothecium foliicola]